MIRIQKFVWKFNSGKKEDNTIVFPKIYMACGCDDELIGVNRKFKGYLENAGLI